MKKNKLFLKLLGLTMCALFTLGTTITVLSCSDGDDSPAEQNQGGGNQPTTYKCSNCKTEYDTQEKAINCAVKSGCPKYVDGLPNTSIAMAKAMTVGWNLGNTLDVHDKDAGKTNKGLSIEATWIEGSPKTTKAMIDAVASKGFKTIRIPVSWHNHITADNGNYPIDSDWMSRVKQIVDWAISNDMYVILNVHHDDLTRAEMQTLYGYCVDKDATLQTTSKAYLSKVWNQIATTFSQYDNRLVFEVLNEPRYRDGENNGFTPPANLSDYNAIIKDYEETCISTIRSVSGNENRFLMVPAYAASPWNIAGWTIPTDSATGKLLISTHAYDPYRFAMGDDNTFDDSVANELTGLFNRIKTNFIDKGYGVVMGEASASDKDNTADRKKWITDYFTKAKNAGIPVVLWDNMVTYENKPENDSAERHGWFNRNNCTWYFDDLTNEMITCAGSTPSNEPPAEDPPANDPPADGVELLTENVSLSDSLWKDGVQLDASKFANVTKFVVTYSALENADYASVKLSYWDSEGTEHGISGSVTGNATSSSTDTSYGLVKEGGSFTFTPDSTGIEELKTKGVKIYGYGVILTSVKVY